MIRPLVKCCGTCRYWDRDSAKDKAGRIRKDRVALCKWPVPPLPAAAWYCKIVPGYVAKDSGKDCPCYFPSARS